MELMVPKLLGSKLSVKKLANAKILPIEKASPSNSKSWTGLLSDAVALGNSHL